MRSDATYALLVQRIAGVMAALPRSEAADLAYNMTAAVNAAIRGQPFEGDSEQIRDLLPPATRTLPSLTCPWDAYQRAHAPGNATLRLEVEPLCTLPASIRLTPEVRQVSGGTGLWAGSLMSCIHNLMDTAHQELLIMVPYWSVGGVKSLLRHMMRPSMEGVGVTILTRGRDELMEDGQLPAVDHLVTDFKRRGARVSVFSPTLVEGKRSLVHAKVVIADRRRAYIGSANFSTSGIEQSLEVGVRLEGRAVHVWGQWIHTLKDLFDEWEHRAPASTGSRTLC